MEAVSDRFSHSNWSHHKYRTQHGRSLWRCQHVASISSPTMSNTLLRQVCLAMEKIAPLRLAERWDNVSFSKFFDLSIPSHVCSFRLDCYWVRTIYTSFINCPIALLWIISDNNNALQSESPVIKQNRRRVLLTVECVALVLLHCALRNNVRLNYVAWPNRSYQNPWKKKLE